MLYKKIVFRLTLIFCILVIGSVYKSNKKANAKLNESFFVDIKLEKGGLKDKKEYLLNNFERNLVIGNKNAPITIIEYSSYTCQYCKAFHNEVYPKIKKNFIEKNLVKYIHKPIVNNKTMLLSTAILCLNDNEKKEVIDNIFFKIQHKEINNIEEYILENVKKYNIDRERFKLCYLDKKNIEETIYYQKKEAEIWGINSVPTLIINGEKYVGYRDYEEMEKIIKEKINRKNHVK